MKKTATVHPNKRVDEGVGVAIVDGHVVSTVPIGCDGANGEDHGLVRDVVLGISPTKKGVGNHVGDDGDGRKGNIETRDEGRIDATTAAAEPAILLLVVLDDERRAGVGVDVEAGVSDGRWHGGCEAGVRCELSVATS